MCRDNVGCDTIYTIAVECPRRNMMVNETLKDQ